MITYGRPLALSSWLTALISRAISSVSSRLKLRTNAPTYPVGTSRARALRPFGYLSGRM